MDIDSWATSVTRGTLTAPGASGGGVDGGGGVGGGRGGEMGGGWGGWMTAEETPTAVEEMPARVASEEASVDVSVSDVDAPLPVLVTVLETSTLAVTPVLVDEVIVGAVEKLELLARPAETRDAVSAVEAVPLLEVFVRLTLTEPEDCSARLPPPAACGGALVASCVMRVASCLRVTTVALALHVSMGRVHAAAAVSVSSVVRVAESVADVSWKSVVSTVWTVIVDEASSSAVSAAVAVSSAAVASEAVSMDARVAESLTAKSMVVRVW
mmetsp:Transcript_19438/g.52578  ORF Transcript_19438/g.52578 Transcript_19438/m.52578 type:complete len:269 (+) Transcript_19438:384-1190(+)